MEERKGHKREIHKERKDKIGYIQGDMAIDIQRKDKLENNLLGYYKRRVRTGESKRRNDTLYLTFWHID